MEFALGVAFAALIAISFTTIFAVSTYYSDHKKHFTKANKALDNVAKQLGLIEQEIDAGYSIMLAKAGPMDVEEKIAVVATNLLTVQQSIKKERKAKG